MELVIDTADQPLIGITSGKFTKTREYPRDLPLSYIIAQHFTDTHTHVNAIRQIQVHPGPGTRFTSTRIGVTVANALGFALQIPVNHQPLAIPEYGKLPNISHPKS